MHEVVRFHQLPPLWYTRQMHDDLSFDHVGLGAAAALRTLIDQRDAYRVRVQQLEQAATACCASAARLTWSCGEAGVHEFQRG